MPRRHIQLLIIDPQNDFCDLPPDWQAAGTPTLPVVGAHADLLRLAELIRAGREGLSGITMTLDSHQRLDIAHPPFWTQADGSAVAPFTPITARQVRDGQYRPRQAEALPRVLAYLDELEARGRYTLMVWPVHCEVGQWGHGVHAAVESACADWEASGAGRVTRIHKGRNPWTEHYSAFQAEVPDAGDPDTQLNRTLLAELDRADLLLIAGEASSHCVRASTEHLVAHLPGGRLERLVLLTDCMSPVAGFEAQADAFLADMRQRGLQLARSTEILPRLLQNRRS